MTGARRRARAAALQVLYEIDSTGHQPEAVLARCLEAVNFSEENRQFVRGLLHGVMLHRKEIDRYIERFAPAWPLGQMAVIDRNILRLAIFEILFDNIVSEKIAINEAVELAKRFGSGNSWKFVNGVLGSVSVFASQQRTTG